MIGQRQADRDLAIVPLAELAAILTRHPDRMAASHGQLRGQGVRFRGSWSSPAVGSDPRSEPISMTRCMPHQIKLTYGRRLLRLHQHPASDGGAQETGTILSIG